jgi:hypothetical protein
VQNKKVTLNKYSIPVSEKYIAEQTSVEESSVAKVDITKHIDSEETIGITTNNTVANNTLQVINNDHNHASILTPVNHQTEEVENRNLVKPAVYKELDTDDERKSLYVGSVEINKDKIRGFLRKASSLFKGRNKNEEEKTEISNSHTLE